MLVATIDLVDMLAGSISMLVAGALSQDRGGTSVPPKNTNAS